MGTAVKVNGHVPGYAGWLIGLGVVAAIAGLVVPSFDAPQELVITLYVVGLLLFAPGIWLLTTARRRETYVADTGTGLVVTDARGTREYSDSDVIRVNYQTENSFSQGVLKKVIRRFDLWFRQDDDSPVHMINDIPVGSADPLAGLITRIIDGYRTRAKVALEKGAALAGPGWEMEANGLTVGQDFIAWDQITQVSIFDRKLCVWRRGVDTAVLKLSFKQENTFLLNILLEEKLEEVKASKPDGAHEDDTGEGLGRILFERRQRTAAWFCLGGGIFCAVIAAGTASEGEEILAGLFGTAAFLLLLAPFRLWFCVFRCHARGVYQVGLFGSGQLLYRDMESFKYEATRMYYNGVYTGTSISMKFEPIPSKGLPSVSYSATVKNADDDLDVLRDFIAQRIAARMYERLAQEGSVAWTPHLSFHREHLSYRPSGFFSRKGEVEIPYSDIYGWNVHEGYFYLWRKGEDKAFVQEPMSAKNFYPGYFLLTWMSQPSSPAGDAAASDATGSEPAS